MGEGNWSVGVPEHGAIEVRHLGRSFNELGKKLTEYIEKRDFIRDTFGRYVTREVVTKLLESKDGLELGGETREITMIMSDIRGFTAHIADMQPHHVVLFLNRYLGKMVEIIQNQGGIVDEIMGDGIFAFFGAPEPLKDHPARAVACALQMQAAMEEVNARNKEDGFPCLEMGIAVHTGTVVVANIGSERRTKYGVVGSDVNLTGRMESYAVGGQVLISHATYKSMPNALDVVDILEVQMKGLASTSVLYDVVGISEPYSVRLPVLIENPIRLPSRIEVLLYALDRKVVAGEAFSASITHFSPKRITVASTYPLNQWDEVKIQILDANLALISRECYAKVISVKQVEGHHECLMRFTSIPSEVVEALQQAANP
jgi:sigma-B regulation protein RsbU (phosphoserine phosphatase)